MVSPPPHRIAQTINQFTGRTWLLPPLVHWLEQSNDRFFLLTGEPGTGKSMIMAWLAGYGPTPTDPAKKATLEHLRAQVKAAHFCVAASGNTAPKAFAETLARQLTRTVEGFGDALIASLADQVRVAVDQDVGEVHAGGRVTGVHIEHLDLGSLSDELSFDRVLRDPLKHLYRNGYAEPMLLLVDALDEAATYTGPIDIVRLLAKLKDLSASVRLLVTTRPDPRVLKYFRGVKPFDLIDDAPAEVDDVRDYTFERLHVFDDEARLGLATRIAEAAEGNFLYAHLIVGDWLEQYAAYPVLRVLVPALPEVPELPDLAALPLPKGLGGLYHGFLNRELGTDEARWYELFRPVLGLIAVARGEGLTRAQLEGMTGAEVARPLRVCKQYLEGALPDGPFRVFHKSFADFLLEDEENRDYPIDAVRQHRRVADYYWDACHDDWEQCDAYELRNLAAHLYDGGDTERLQALISRGWMQARYAGSGYTYGGFLADVDLAWQAAEEHDDVVSLVRLQTARQVVGAQVGTYSDTHLETLVWLGRKEEAVGHARLRPSAREKCVGLLAIYDTLREQGESDGALLEEAVEVARAIPNDIEQARALGKVAAALAQAGRFEEALEAAHAIPLHSHQAEALGKVAAAFAQAGRFEEALEIARAISEDVYSQAVALTEAASSLAQVGDQRASGVLEEALAATRANLDYIKHAGALGAVATALAQAGDQRAARVFQEAIEATRAIANWARAVSAVPIQAGALGALAAALAQAGDERATRVFQEALAAARAISATYYQAEALTEVAAALARAGRFEEALAVARAIPHDTENQAVGLGAVASTLARAGRFEEALAAARAISENVYSQVEALEAVASALAQAGHFEDALEIARAIPYDTQNHLDALGAVATALAQAGRFRDALRTFGAPGIDGFLESLAQWAPAFERTKPGLSVAVLREATGVAGWFRPDWQKVHNLLATPQAPPNTGLGTGVAQATPTPAAAPNRRSGTQR